MRISSIIIVMLMLWSCSATGKEKAYTGSTPAAPLVRSFLGIPLGDSIDFIRWHLFLRDNQYQLRVNYGLGKPNTDGFINGGIKSEISGLVKREGNHYVLQNRNRSLRLVELNEDLLHFLNPDRTMIVGNGGWSYTLNNVAPVATDQVSVHAAQATLRDSMVFDGRTPCAVPGVVRDGKGCYKLKWRIVLYADARQNKPTGFKVLGTVWRDEGGITGNWQIVKGKNNRTIYRLNAKEGDLVLYLLKTDENLLVFTDKAGKLLVGDEDFSYTLNKIK